VSAIHCHLPPGGEVAVSAAGEGDFEVVPLAETF
jgi:hypothetical protein